MQNLKRPKPPRTPWTRHGTFERPDRTLRVPAPSLPQGREDNHRAQLRARARRPRLSRDDGVLGGGSALSRPGRASVRPGGLACSATPILSAPWGCSGTCVVPGSAASTRVTATAVPPRPGSQARCPRPRPPAEVRKRRVSPSSPEASVVHAPAQSETAARTAAHRPAGSRPSAHPSSGGTTWEVGVRFPLGVRFLRPCPARASSCLFAHDVFFRPKSNATFSPSTFPSDSRLSLVSTPKASLGPGARSPRVSADPSVCPVGWWGQRPWGAPATELPTPRRTLPRHPCHLLG